MFHADGRTDRQIHGRMDMTKATVDFRNFANAPKNAWKKGGDRKTDDNTKCKAS